MWRLGLRTALASPIGTDAEGDLLRGALATESVRWTGRSVAGAAVTVVLPVDGDRAMATVDGGEFTHAEELAEGDPRAVIVSLPRIGLAPRGARLYATVGDIDARHGALPPAVGEADALIVNAREAEMLTQAPGVAEAARQLAATGTCAVVTRGADGAIACDRDGELVAVPAQEPAGPVVDTTGAGDLFTAAYVWADLAGAPLEERLRWAVLYAGRSVGVPTGTAGAMTRTDLAAAGAGLGLAPPAPYATTVSRRDSE